MLTGSVEFRVGENVYQISEGDSLTYSPSEPLAWRNSSETDEARLMWVLTG